MKNVVMFIKKNPMFVLLSLVILALLFFEEGSGSVIMAMATGVSPGMSPSAGISGL